MLQHYSHKKYHYDIVKNGWLQPSIKTKNNANHFELASWIYTRINTDINKEDREWATFVIDPMCLLHSEFILHTSWTSELDECSHIIDGKKLKKSEIKKILEHFKKISIHNFDIEKILNKEIKGYSSISYMSNEILIKEDIDLHQYLLEYHGDDKKTIEYLKEHYPKVKIIKKKFISKF